MWRLRLPLSFIDSAVGTTNLDRLIYTSPVYKIMSHTGLGNPASIGDWSVPCMTCAMVFIEQVGLKKVWRIECFFSFLRFCQ